MSIETRLFALESSFIRFAQWNALCHTAVCDSILVVAGIDSRDDLGSIKALNWLLLGMCGHSLANPVLGDETFDDVIVLVHKGGSRIYCTPPAVRKIRATTSSWPNCEIICMNEHSFRDQDLFEEHKMESFKKMVQDVGRIGVPVTGDPKRTIEKWPIVQSYALDSTTGESKHFFTLEHSVVDVTTQLNSIYVNIDPQAATVLLRATTHMILHHWKSMFDKLDSLIGDPKQCWSELSAMEKQNCILEPLGSYYDYATLRNKETLSSHGVHPPTIRLFPTTEHQTEHHDYTHFVVEFADPVLPVRTSRTYLLNTGQGPSMDVLGRYKGKMVSPVPDESRTAATMKLLELYNILAEVVQKHLTLGATEQQLHEAIVTTAKAHKNVELPELKGQQLFLRIEKHDLSVFVDNTNTPPTADADYPIHAVFICAHIKGVTVRGIKLGDIVYGDTFICAHDERLLSVTGDIAPFDCWNLSVDGLKSVNNFHKITAGVKQAWQYATKQLDIQQPLGQLVADWDNTCGVAMCLPTDSVLASYSPSCTAMVFQHGIMINHRQLGPLEVLHWSESANPDMKAGLVESVTVHDDLDLNSPILIALHFAHDSSPSHLLSVLQRRQPVEGTSSKHGSIVLCLHMHSTAKHEFLRKVLPTWKSSWNDQSTPFTIEEKIPLHLVNNNLYIKNRIVELNERAASMEMGDRDLLRSKSEQESYKESIRQIIKNYPRYEQQERVICKQVVQYLYSKRVKKEVPIMFPAAPSSSPTQAVQLYIMNGIPGSGKHAFCRNVQNSINPHPNKVIFTVEQPMDEGITLNPSFMEREVLRLASCETQKQIHVLVITPGYTSVSVMTHTVNNIINKSKTAIHLKGCVTIVNTDNFFANHVSKPPFEVLPHLFDQCTMGCISAVFIRSTTSSISTSEVETHMKKSNPHCSMFYDKKELLRHLQLLELEDEEPVTIGDLYTTEMCRLRKLAMLDTHLYINDVDKLCSVRFKTDIYLSHHAITHWMTKITDPNQHEIIRVHAKLHIDGCSRSLDVVNGKAYLSTFSMPQVDKVVMKEQNFFIVGRNLNQQKIIDMLKEHMASKESLMKHIVDAEESNGDVAVFFRKGIKPLLTRDMLVKEDIDEIAKQNYNTPLPDGCFYDGVNYIDWQGTRSKVRPDMEDLVMQYIKVQNAVIEKHNAELNQTPTKTK